MVSINFAKLENFASKLKGRFKKVENQRGHCSWLVD
jgi:hypothetical protein